MKKGIVLMLLLFRSFGDANAQPAVDKDTGVPSIMMQRDNLRPPSQATVQAKPTVPQPTLQNDIKTLAAPVVAPTQPNANNK